MADIFISYSSKDREQAEQLTELLASAGLSVWIDQAGIEVATSWSGEIVDAIDGCKAMVVLLSPSSNLSKNVAKEVALAAERNKQILPLDLEPVQLSRDLAYHLAGLQRTSSTNIDGIIRAIAKLGLEPTQAPTVTVVKATDARKSLMILPFEDLSPTGDNGWFADGLASELINSLSPLKALRVADHQATKDYKRYQGTLPRYAKEMEIRYFIQGQVRKFGDQIKISITLLDIETGDHLWQNSMKGTMSDVFEIQEQVAANVVEGLKVHLASNEKRQLAHHGTENAEAYELYLKAREYFLRYTKDGLQFALQLLTETIWLDPGYAEAYQMKANVLTSLYQAHERDPALLDEAERLCNEALKLKPELLDVYYPLSRVYLHRGLLAEAEEIAKEYIRKDPESGLSYATLASFYNSTSQYAKAIAPCEDAVRLLPDHTNLWNLVITCDAASELEKRAHWAAVALPEVKRHLKLHPDDQNTMARHAALLVMTGKTEEAHEAVESLARLNDGGALFNAAHLFIELGDTKEALATFRKVIDVGFKDIRLLNGFLMDELAILAGTPEYEEVRRRVQEIEAKTRENG